MTGRAVVFDLFHTLIDPEPHRPDGFDQVSAIAAACRFDRAEFDRFWAATYIERETTTIDVIDLVQRHASTDGIVLGPEQRQQLDTIFGAAEDAAMLAPDDRLVDLLARVATVVPVGVLSNCHEHEVRRWPDSPFVPHVTVLGRSSRIGAMKPDRRAYDWISDRLDADPGASIYVGNGGGDELGGARDAGFGTIVHVNAMDRLHGVIPVAEQRRRAAHASVSVDSIDDIVATIERIVFD